MARKRKMSQRHRRARRVASTQTEESGFGSATNSPRLSHSSITHDDSLDDRSQLLSSAACASAVNHRDSIDDKPRLSASSVSQDSNAPDDTCTTPNEFYEEQSALYERLVKAEEVRSSYLQTNLCK